MKFSTRILLYLLVLILCFRYIATFSSGLDKVSRFISPSQFQIFPLDIIIGLIILLSLLNQGVFLRGKLSKNALQHFALFYLFLGLVAVIVGFSRGEHNLFFDFRLYFFFLLSVSLPILVRGKRDLYRLVKFIIALSAMVAFYALVVEYFIKGVRYDHISLNRAMNLWVLVILLCLVLAKQKGIFQKIASYFFVPLSFLALVANRSRKQYLGLLVVFLFLLYKKRHLILNKKVIIVGLVILLIIVAANASNIFYLGYQRFRGGFISDRDYSAAYRLHAWSLTLKEVVLKHPVFGLGTGDKFDFYNKLSQTLPKEFYGFGLWNARIGLHNIYLTIFMIGGSIGFGAFLFLILSILKKGWLAYQKLSGRDKYLALGIFLGFFTFLVTGFFEGLSITWMVQMWFFAGLCLVVYNISLQEEETT